jgi:cytidylate kinase
MNTRHAADAARPERPESERGFPAPSPMGRPPLIVTLDGPAGVGKSTLARKLAAALGTAYLDTGAMFRRLALALKGNAELEERHLQRIFGGLHFDLRGCGDASRLFCNGEPVGDEIRTEEAGAWASRIAGSAPVRAFLKTSQQALGARLSLVAEGRDTGTVIFPHARHKFFLDAAPEVRAARRLRELEARGERHDPAALAADMRERDRMDSERALAPLRPAPDAVLVDTSGLDIDAVFDALMRRIGA